MIAPPEHGQASNRILGRAFGLCSAREAKTLNEHRDEREERRQEEKDEEQIEERSAGGSASQAGRTRRIRERLNIRSKHLVFTQDDFKADKLGGSIARRDARLRWVVPHRWFRRLFDSVLLVLPRLKQGQVRCTGNECRRDADVVGALCKCKLSASAPLCIAGCEDDTHRGSTALASHGHR